MNQFPSDREAKEYLVSKIVEEAQREGVALSEVERKMLYFAESGWTLPDIMEVNEEFDREYDPTAYESKIAKLSHRIVKRIRKVQSEEYEAWKEAVRRLSKGDHYLLVMVGQADGMDPWKAWGIGFAIAVVFVGAIFISVAYGIDLGKHLPSRDGLIFVVWAILVSLGVVYVLLRLFFGARVGTVTDRLLERMFGGSKRDD
jgi:hypothetical protein